MVSGVVLYLLGPVAMYVLGPGTFSLLVDNTQVWTIHNDSIMTNMEKVKMEAEQQITELSSRNIVLIEDLTRMEAAKV